MKKIISILCCAALAAACNDFLDIQPKGQIIPTLYSDYAGLLYETSMTKSTDLYPVNLTDDVLYPAGEQPNKFSSQDEEEKRLYRFDHGDIFNEGVQDDMWMFAFQRIYVYNNVINNIMSAKGAGEDEKRTLRAEALASRAFDYLNLVNVYAPAYDAATAATDYGVPLLTEDKITDQSRRYARKSVAEVYEFIKKDLDEALPYLLESPPNFVKPSKAIGFSLYARMYLYMRDYGRALENALEALERNSELTDLTLYTALPDKQDGRIVLDSDHGVFFPRSQDNPECVFLRFSTRTFGMTAEVYASRDLLDVYNRDLGPGARDMRRTLWFVDNSHPKVAGNFDGYTMLFSFLQENVGFTSVENMLIAAECYARKGDAASLAEASRLYNALRDKRIKNNLHVDLTAADAVRKVLDERRRELAFKGIHRYFDLKRLNKEPALAKTVTHTLGTETFTLPANDNRWIMPLPPTVRSFRPDLPDYTR